MALVQARPAQPNVLSVRETTGAHLGRSETRQADMMLPPKNLSLSKCFPFREFSEPAVLCVQQHPVLVSPLSPCERPAPAPVLVFASSGQGIPGVSCPSQTPPTLFLTDLGAMFL